MKKIIVIFYALVSVITAVEIVAAIWAINAHESIWILMSVAAVITGVVTYILGGKVFGDLTADKDEDCDE